MINYNDTQKIKIKKQYYVTQQQKHNPVNPTNPE